MREGQSSFLGKTVLKPSLEVISKRIIIPHIKKCYRQLLCTQDRESLSCYWLITGFDLVTDSTNRPWVAVGTWTLTTVYNKPPSLPGSWQSCIKNTSTWYNEAKFQEKKSVLLWENIALPFYHPGSSSRLVRTRKDQCMSLQCQNRLKNERFIGSLCCLYLWHKQICDCLGIEWVPLDIAEPEGWWPHNYLKGQKGAQKRGWE